MDDSNDYAICAYDPSHKVLKHRLASHQTKCRKKYPNSKVLICQNNSTHHIHRNAMKEHLNHCKMDIGVQPSTRFDNASSDHNLNQANASFLLQNSDVFVDGENWETNEEHHDTVLLSKYSSYFTLPRRNREAILALGKKGKTEFDDAEKERIQRLQDKKCILDLQYPNARGTFSTIEDHLKALEKIADERTFPLLKDVKAKYNNELKKTKSPDVCERKSTDQDSHLFTNKPNGETAKENNEKESTSKDFGADSLIQDPFISKDLQHEASAFKLENNSWSSVVKNSKALSMNSKSKQSETPSKTLSSKTQCGNISSIKPINRKFQSTTETKNKCKVETNFGEKEFYQSECNKKTEMQETRSVRPKIFKTLDKLQNKSEIVHEKRSKTKFNNSDLKILEKSEKFQPSYGNMVHSEISKPVKSNNRPFQENFENFEMKIIKGKSSKIVVKLNPEVSLSGRKGENEMPAIVKTKDKLNIVPTLQKKIPKDVATSRENETCELKKKFLPKEGTQHFPSHVKPIYNLEDEECKISKSKDFNIKAENFLQLPKNSRRRRTRRKKVETKLGEQKVDSLTKLPEENVENDEWQLVQSNCKKSLKSNLETMRREKA